MGNRLLSQEEIDALLHDEPVAEQGNERELTKFEADTLGEIGNIAMGTAATTLSQLINRKVMITTPQVTQVKKENLSQEYPVPHVIVDVEYSQGLMGSNLLVIQKEDAQVIAQLMLGQDPAEEVEIDELRLSALGEAMNQMMGSAATALSTVFNQVVNIQPPQVDLVDFTREDPQEILNDEGTNVVKTSFQLTIEELVDSEIMLLLPLEFAKEMTSMLQGNGTSAAGDERVTEAGSDNDESYPIQAGEQQPIIQPVQFAPLESRERAGEKGNFDLLLDIPLEVSVELGRTKRQIKEVLELGIGSLLELERSAGEPVDILVNGKLIAKGEVVVIGENFGVRITEIVGLQERVKTLQ